MRGSVELHGRLVVWAPPAVMPVCKLGCIGGHPDPELVEGEGQYRGNPERASP